MKTRVSIAEVMTVILLIAVDIRGIRSIVYQEGNPTDALLSTAGTLVFTVLGAGMLDLGRRRRRGEFTLFLIGFEIAGGTGLLLFSLVAVRLPDLLLDHFKGVWSSYISYMARTSMGRSGYFIFTIELAMIVHFSTILLIPAIIAGLLVRGRKRVPSEGQFGASRLSDPGSVGPLPPGPSLQRAQPLVAPPF